MDYKVLRLMDKQTVQCATLYIVDNFSKLAISEEAASDVIDCVGQYSFFTGVAKAPLVVTESPDVAPICRELCLDFGRNTISNVADVAW